MPGLLPYQSPTFVNTGTVTPPWVPPAPATLIHAPSNSSQTSPVPVHSSTPATPVHFLQSVPSSQNSPVPPSSIQIPSPSGMIVQPANLPVPSTSSPSESLLHPDVVIQKYPKLRTLSTAGRLAVRLAIESYFGKELLRQSTVYGQKDLPPLPRDKVMQLKNKLLSIHLANVSSEVEFEAVWTKCVNAVNHSASSLRSKKPLPLSVLNN